MGNYFRHFYTFINQNVGKQIKRQQLIELCVLKDCDTSNNTIDAYINMSKQLGYITPVIRGVYTVNKQLPENYTIHKLRKDYDNLNRKTV